MDTARARWSDSGSRTASAGPVALIAPRTRTWSSCLVGRPTGNVGAVAIDVRPLVRAAGRDGVVPIEAIIGRDGTVNTVRVLTAQVHPDFAIAAVDAVRQWRFSPTLLNGAPVEVVMNVSVTFNLAD